MNIVYRFSSLRYSHLRIFLTISRNTLLPILIFSSKSLHNGLLLFLQQALRRNQMFAPRAMPKEKMKARRPCRSSHGISVTEMALSSALPPAIWNQGL